MASTCISRCVEDTRVPIRATYVNLYKWPESDFEFVRSMSSSKKTAAGHKRDTHDRRHPTVVDSISCRQLYLRSYTFSREEDYAAENNHKSAVNCLGRRRKEHENAKKKKNRPAGASCSGLASVFRRLLSCTTKIDVAN